MKGSAPDSASSEKLELDVWIQHTHTHIFTGKKNIVLWHKRFNVFDLTLFYVDALASLCWCRWCCCWCRSKAAPKRYFMAIYALELKHSIQFLLLFVYTLCTARSFMSASISFCIFHGTNSPKRSKAIRASKRTNQPTNQPTNERGRIKNKMKQ